VEVERVTECELLERKMGIRIDHLEGTLLARRAG